MTDFSKITNFFTLLVFNYCLILTNDSSLILFLTQLLLCLLIMDLAVVLHTCHGVKYFLTGTTLESLKQITYVFSCIGLTFWDIEALSLVLMLNNTELQRNILSTGSLSQSLIKCLFSRFGIFTYENYFTFINKCYEYSIRMKIVRNNRLSSFQNT